MSMGFHEKIQLLQPEWLQNSLLVAVCFINHMVTISEPIFVMLARTQRFSHHHADNKRLSHPPAFD